MKRILALFFPMTLLLAIGASAAEVQGIIVDQVCAADHVADGKGYAFAKEHTRDCALMPPCVKGGYGVFTEDGKYLKLDAAGNKKAEAALQATDKKDDIHVKVTGDEKDGTIAVEDLTIL